MSAPIALASFPAAPVIEFAGINTGSAAGAVKGAIVGGHAGFYGGLVAGGIIGGSRALGECILETGLGFF